MSKEALETPGVIEKINNQIQENNQQSSFKIIESEWSDNHVYMEAFTNVVQQTQMNTEE
jgi:REP element-mobilizing transposase RayT